MTLTQRVRSHVSWIARQVLSVQRVTLKIHISGQNMHSKENIKRNITLFVVRSIRCIVFTCTPACGALRCISCYFKLQSWVLGDLCLEYCVSTFLATLVAGKWREEDEDFAVDDKGRMVITEVRRQGRKRERDDHFDYRQDGAQDDDADESRSMKSVRSRGNQSVGMSSRGGKSR